MSRGVENESEKIGISLMEKLMMVDRPEDQRSGFKKRGYVYTKEARF